MAEGERDDRRLEPNSPEWHEERRRRHGHPTGPHIRDEDAEMPPRPVSDYIGRGDRAELAAMLDGLKMGANPPAPPLLPRTEVGKHITVALSAVGLALTVGVSAVQIIQSNTRLYDKVENQDERLRVVEGRQAVNVPILQAQVNENHAQADTINALREAMADERKTRVSDESEIRLQNSATLGIIDRLAQKVSEIDKAVAVMGASGRRSEIPGPPEHDAQLRPR